LTTEVDEGVVEDVPDADAPRPEGVPDADAPRPEDVPDADAPRPEGDEEELREAAQTELSLLAEAARFATPERARAVVEALLFAAEKPLDIAQLEETTRFSRQLIESALAELSARFAPGSGGIVLVDLQGRFHLRTDPQVGAYVRRMLQVRPMRLTRAALETLAIVAYRQPVTRPEIEDLRGVDCGAVTRALLERKLIRILGKKDEPGRPLLYGTTKEFLELFNLRDLTQLPTLREFQELSEESRKIVEEEAPASAAPGGDVFAAAGDAAADERIAMATAESDAALDQLEKAMQVVAQQAQAAEATLAPQAPPPTGGDESAKANSQQERPC
jgi:segregation and condensation protein B